MTNNMRQICIIMAFLASALSMQAQTIEDFEANSLGWNEYSSPRQSAIIKEGALHMENFVDDIVMASCYTPLDVTEAWKVKAQFKGTKIDSDNRGVGIVINYLDDMNYDCFMFSKELIVYSRYIDGHEVGKRYAQLKVDRKIKDHILIVEYANNKIQFSINDVMCIEIKNAPIKYNGFGLAVWGKGQKADVEEIQFIQQ